MAQQCASFIVPAKTSNPPPETVLFRNEVSRSLNLCIKKRRRAQFSSKEVIISSQQISPIARYPCIDDGRRRGNACKKNVPVQS